MVRNMARRIGRVPRSVNELVVQLAGIGAVLYGIQMWSVGAAFVVGGIAAILVIERQ